jgi:hypothetical protein
VADISWRKEAVITFYRDELRDRYQVKNVKRFEPFQGIEDRHIDALREYFLENIYPPAEERIKLDLAFDHLGDVLRSPRRMQPLMTTALSSFWRFGLQLPTAVNAARHTFDAYRETRKLEGFMLANAEKINLSKADTRKRETMLTLISDVPERDVVRLIDDILNLFRTLSNIKLLSTTVKMLDHFIDVMVKRPDLFNEADVAGISLGRQVVSGGLHLFERMTPEELPRVVDGIRLVEYDWYERVKAGVAG